MEKDKMEVKIGGLKVSTVGYVVLGVGILGAVIYFVSKSRI